MFTRLLLVERLYSIDFQKSKDCMTYRSWLYIGISVVGAVCLYLFFAHSKGDRAVTFYVNYNQTGLTSYTNNENTPVEEALKEAGYAVDGAYVFPDRKAPLTAGTIITLHSAKPFILKDHNEERSLTSTATTVAEALELAGVTLEGADFVEPSLDTALISGMTVQVTRVTVSEETEETKIPFKKVEEEDETLSFLVKKVTQKGVPGVRTARYKVSRHNDTIVAKEKIDETVTKEPVDEKTVRGTKVTVVKKHSGGASWYAHTGTLAGANPWLPFGSYVRVTNTANGKSVIVKINDRGPFGAGRIIDLDKVAFAQIADLGTGVINVVMEEIK